MKEMGHHKIRKTEEREGKSRTHIHHLTTFIIMMISEGKDVNEKRRMPEVDRGEREWVRREGGRMKLKFKTP